MRYLRSADECLHGAVHCVKTLRADLSGAGHLSWLKCITWHGLLQLLAFKKVQQAGHGGRLLLQSQRLIQLNSLVGYDIRRRRKSAAAMVLPTEANKAYQGCSV